MGDEPGFFSVFSPGRLADIISAMRMCVDRGFDLPGCINEALSVHSRLISAFVDATPSPPQSAFKTLKPTYLKLCPSCGNMLLLSALNIPQGRRNLYGFKSRWVCPICLHEEFSLLPPAEAVKPFLVEKV